MEEKVTSESSAARVQEEQTSFPSHPEKTPASSRDLDETYNAYKQQDARDIDPQEAREVLRKIDRNLLPLLMVTYMLQYLDKSSINFASVFGLQKGTHLQGQEYSWLTSLFYIGYLVAQPAAGYLLQRLPVGKFIGSTAVSMYSRLSPFVIQPTRLTSRDNKSGACSLSRRLPVPILQA